MQTSRGTNAPKINADTPASANFSELSIEASRIFRPSYADFLKLNIGTVCNGKVFVAVSNISIKSPDGGLVYMLGLFANQEYKSGDVVTGYGGCIRHYFECKHLDDNEARYIRKIPNGDWCLDGKPFADQFSMTQEEMAEEFKMAPLSRRRCSPSLLIQPHEKSLSEPERSAIEADSLDHLQAFMTFHRIKQCLCLGSSTGFKLDCCVTVERRRADHDSEFSNMEGKRAFQVLRVVYDIAHSSIGYMANTSSKADINLSVQYYNKKRFRNEVGLDDILYVASRDIKQGEELYAPYNNLDSRRLLGKNQTIDDFVVSTS